jgi:hypothetical protein
LLELVANRRHAHGFMHQILQRWQVDKDPRLPHLWRRLPGCRSSDNDPVVWTYDLAYASKGYRLDDMTARRNHNGYSDRVIHIECKACGHEVDIAPAETYVCPERGAIDGLDIALTLDDSAEAHESLRTKAYDEDGKKFLDSKTGDNYFRKDEEWHDLTQVVNRRENRYKKRVVRKSTGEVLRDEDGPLDQHEPTAVKRRREVTDQ